jgi:hypothetical protein
MASIFTDLKNQKLRETQLLISELSISLKSTGGGAGNG